MPDAAIHLTLPIHRVHLRHRIGVLEIEVDFTLDAPWTVLFGPSGCGKTTILRLIAGLLKPDSGRVLSTAMPGTTLEQTFVLTDTGAKLFVPPHRRVIRLAPQRPSLFPHLTVFENLTYGAPPLGPRGVLSSWRDQANEALQSFGLKHIADRYPHRISGGEAQRLNVARAVTATGCRLLLLDEPFAGLDAARRDDLLAHLKSTLAKRKTQVLSVTHDIAEAFQLNAEVIKLHQGRIVQQGPAPLVLAEERTRLLAQLNQPIV